MFNVFDLMEQRVLVLSLIAAIMWDFYAFDVT